jgi:DNA-directed RNA polymerase subunit M/transcription elongation factor TFIIS
VYTEQDLMDAVAAKDFARVAEISSWLDRNKPKAKAPRKAAKPKAGKAASPPAKTSPSPAPRKAGRSDPPGLPWLAPSLSPRPAPNVDDNIRPDLSKMKFETDKKTFPNLTAAQKREERERKKDRDPNEVRDPARKQKTTCERCKKKFNVYPSELGMRVDEQERTEFFYRCPGCSHLPSRG